MTLELGGKITIECEKTQCYTELEFKLKVLWSSKPSQCQLIYFFNHNLTTFSLYQPFLGSSCNVNQISGKIRMGEDVLATVDGHWVRVFSEQSTTFPQKYQNIFF